MRCMYNIRCYSLFVCFINQLVGLYVVDDDASHVAAREDAAFSLVAGRNKMFKEQPYYPVLL